MGPRVYFHAEGITVTADALRVRSRIFQISEVLEARCERSRVWWLWPFKVHSYALDVTLLAGRKVRAARRHDAYFIFQLVNAIQAAVEESQQVDAPLVENSSA